MSNQETHGGGIFDFLGNAINTVAHLAPAVISTAVHLAPLIAAGIHIRHIEKHLGLKHHLTPIEKKKYLNASGGSYVENLEKDGAKNKIQIDLSKFTHSDKKYLLELILRMKRILTKSS